MPIIGPGKPKCSLCGQVIDRREELIATPPFVRRTHPLWLYSDAAFHRACFERSPDRAEVERLLARAMEVMRDAPADMAEYERWIGRAMKEFE